ncbi:riboflavin biosynthesis protein [Bacillus freudenreichii]|nr:riboflavin biosynthesis protein [Bacillus freudenreichii]
MMTIKEKKSIINLPDLQFVRYCAETYGLNRGVYNTIDEWFYMEDIKDIKKRREKILEFLLFSIRSMDKKEGGNRLRFGKGNLVNLLEEYSENQALSWLNAQ